LALGCQDQGTHVADQASSIYYYQA